jgi:hypothetical protein
MGADCERTCDSMTPSRSQTDMILADLRAGLALTQLDAMRLYGCSRLAARIQDIEDFGVPVVCRTIEVKCRGGRSARVAEYRLAAPQGELQL